MIFQGPTGYIAQICEVHLQYGNSTTKWPFYTFFLLIPLYIFYSLWFKPRVKQNWVKRTRVKRHWVKQQTVKNATKGETTKDQNGKTYFMYYFRVRLGSEYSGPSAAAREG